VRGQQRPLPAIGNLPEKQQEVYSLLVDSVLALQRENKEVLWGSMVKETMKRKKPSFNETYYGFRTFSHLLEESQRKGIVQLRRDQKSGSYVIEDLGAGSIAGGRPEPAPAQAAPVAAAPVRAAEPAAAAVSAPAAPAGEADAANGRARSRRRTRGGRGRTRTSPAGAAGAAVTNGPEAGDEASEASGEAAEERHGEEPAERHEAVPEAPSHERSAEPEVPPPAQPPADREPTPAERFSLFSWIRREAPLRHLDDEPEPGAKDTRER
jgi:hypothetical protein